jgi:serine/threonine protein kinase
MFETLGHYKILDRVGAGDLGEVYRARDTRVGRTVAVRIVTAAIANDAALKERFMSDARASMALSHPGIATLYDVAEDQGALFIVSEFAPGDSLSTVVAGRPLNPRRAIDLAAQIADGLSAGHDAGIAHGDLSSRNVIVTPKGNAKILDFGLSRWREPETATQETSGRAFDPGPDVLALGAVLYEMLTGTRPRTGVPTSTLMRDAQLAPDLAVIVRKGVIDDAQKRYQSASMFSADLREFAAALDAKAAEPRATPPTTPARKTSPIAKSNQRPSTNWVVAVLVLAAIAGVGAWIERDPLRDAIRQIAARLLR